MSDALAAFRGQQYMSLTTFRKNGEGVATPIWFAEENGKFYATTSPVSGKVKRLRNNPRVTVAPCTMKGDCTGAQIEATARILPPGSAETAHVHQLIRKKYGFQVPLFEFVYRVRAFFSGEKKTQGEDVCLEISCQ